MTGDHLSKDPGTAETTSVLTQAPAWQVADLLRQPLVRNGEPPPPAAAEVIPTRVRTTGYRWHLILARAFSTDLQCSKISMATEHDPLAFSPRNGSPNLGGD